jgi:CRISPR-associated protein (TIGR03986 family)
MALRHDNPTRPRRDKDGRELWARAPYNFVPLPEKLVEANTPLSQDRYHQEGETGWIVVELETLSPTYVRGMLTEAQFAEFGRPQAEEAPDGTDADPATRRQRQQEAEALALRKKETQAPFFSTGEQKEEGFPRPLIPGSSLRGMTRKLVEIIGYGRLRWVGREPTFTFRAVAAPTSDPLREPYRDVLGAFGANVRAGYLVQNGDKWSIRPALTPQRLGLPGKEGYLKVKESVIRSNDVTGYVRLDSPHYKPNWFRVSFDAQRGPSRQGDYAAVTRVGDRAANLRYQGVLVCSGNMMEAQGEKTEREGRKRTRRKNQALILLPDEKAALLPIRPQAVEDYRAGLTPYQNELEKWGGKGYGCLKHGAPVFYVPEGNEVSYFGHSPNFRIPARLRGANKPRAATPPDFIPDVLRDEELGPDTQPDLAEAIFGWVYDGENPNDRRWKDDSRKRDKQRGGRVLFGDARMTGARDGVWWRPEPFAPRTLSGPKPTTFQHYLAQNRRAGREGHDPDRKESLAHYGTPPGETELRGHKLYWTRGANPPLEASAAELEHERQLTRLMPLKPGVSFTFKIHFENLRKEELGALWWALTLPGPAAAGYCHRLGMGKPLGMGAVKLSPRLFLTDRRARYESLFADNGWSEAATEADGQKYAQAFEAFLLQERGIGGGVKRLVDAERIRTLLTMLEWREGDADWLDKTRYMEIERGDEGVNEYKERPVLPDPLEVVRMRLPRIGADRLTPTGSARPTGDQGRPPSRPTQRDDSDMKRGRIKKYVPERSYGFIAADDGGPDLYFRQEWVQGDVTLQENVRVRYRPVKGPDGRAQAKDVRAA